MKFIVNWAKVGVVFPFDYYDESFIGDKQQQSTGVVLRNFAKFTGKHLCQTLFFNKVPNLRTGTLLKKSVWHRCFPVNFAKFLRTTFFTEHLRWLFLDKKVWHDSLSNWAWILSFILKVDIPPEYMSLFSAFTKIFSLVIYIIIALRT